MIKMSCALVFIPVNVLRYAEITRISRAVWLLQKTLLDCLCCTHMSPLRARSAPKLSLLFKTETASVA
jgi:hypothetical protein